MPVITLHRERFSKYLGKELSVEEMEKWLPWLGTDIEDVGPDYVKVEYNPNRLDFSSHVGLARALKGLLGIEVGMPRYDVKSGGIVVNVDPSVERVRPYVLSAVVRGVKLDEDLVREIMDMQEDIHWGVGRDRRKAAIGIHNLDVLVPPFTYKAVSPDAKFIPLDKTREMSISEILKEHEKGVAYAHLLKHTDKYPVIVDSLDRIFTFPPIINSELTRVTPETKNIFIDVTGPSMDAVKMSLNLVVTALADMGGRVESVQVRYPDETLISPDLTPLRMRLRTSYANSLLGLNLTDEEAAECLRRCRLDARVASPGVLEVSVPAYRIDVMHEVDLVEEVAIGYGLYRMTPTRPKGSTSGRQHPVSRVVNCVRMIMIGLGFTEVVNFVLTNEDVHYRMMRMEFGGAVRLANPASALYSIARTMLLPGLMQNLSTNRHESYPQRLFEVSDVIVPNEDLATKAERRVHVAAVSAHSKADFTEIKACMEALLRNLGVDGWGVEEARHPSFIEGRTAQVTLHGEKLGLVGEIHPEVLNNFGLENPVGAFELDLEPIIRTRRAGTAG